MLDEVERAMVGGDRQTATTWLGNLLRANGQEAVSQAYQMLLTAKGEGQLIARVLPWWSKTAASLKGKAEQAPKPAKSRARRELEYLDGAGRCP